MLALTHAAIALAVIKVLGLPATWWELGLVVIFAVLPDIDIPSSWLGKLFRPLAEFLYVKFGHRSITHSLIFLFLSSVPFALWPKLCVLVLVGVSSHLISDSLTYSGIKLFWPRQEHIVLLGGPLLTGRWVDWALLVSAAVIFLVI